MAAKQIGGPILQPRHGPQRPDCVAGVGGLELRNVVANYHFESSRGFPGSEPNSGPGDQSRLSCSAEDTQLGAGFCRDLQLSVLHGRWPSCGVAEKARIGRDLFRPCLPRKEMDARHQGRGMTVMTAI